jgi:glutathione S-transferase
VFDTTPRVRAWREALSQRESVRRAVGADYAQRLERFLIERGSALSRRMERARHTAAHA